LRRLLLRTCEKEGITIVWDSKMVNYEEKGNQITVNFERKEPVQTDILIAADGVNSPTRNQMVGDPLIYTGFSTLLFLVHSNKGFTHPWFTRSGGIIIAPNKSIFFYDHPTANEFLWSVTAKVPEGTIPSAGGEEPAKYLEYVRELLKDFAPLAQELIDATTVDNTTFTLIEFKDRTPLLVDKKSGRLCVSSSRCITLLGDAAHPMIPMRTAGGNNALTDAWSLTNQLSTLLSLPSVTNEDINRVLSIYEKEMGPRGAHAVLASRKAANDFHTDNRVKIYIRDTLICGGNWYLNVYRRKKWIQWTVRSTVAASVVAAAALAQHKFHLIPACK